MLKLVNICFVFYITAHHFLHLIAIPRPENNSLPKSYREYLSEWKNLIKISYEKISHLHESFEQNLKLGNAFNIDPKLWNNLNGETIYLKYPGIIFLNSYKQPQMVVKEFNLTSVTEASLNIAKMIYHRMLTSIHVLCMNMTRYGNIDDGGWEVCSSPPYDLDNGCSVYSFGINFDFSFDDDIGISNNCSVMTFDPSMSTQDHVRSDNVFFYQVGLGPMNSVTKDRWIIKSFKNIINLLQSSEKIIDILKIDIEYDEWDSLQEMINDGSLLNVKQLLFEAHTVDIKDNNELNDDERLQHFVKLYSILADLELKCHFRRFYYHENVFGQKNFLENGKLLNCCYELYYINLRFL